MEPVRSKTRRRSVVVQQIRREYCQPSGALEHERKLSQYGCWVSDVLDHPAADHHIEGAVSKRQPHRVSANAKMHSFVAADLRLNVDADPTARRLLREVRAEVLPGSTAHIEDPVAG